MTEDPDRTPEIGTEKSSHTREIPSAFGRYHQVQYHKAGGQGLIYVGNDVKGAWGKVAIKIPRDMTAEGVRAFLEEAAKSALMKHPHIVRVLDFDTIDEHTPYVVTPYFPRGSLADLLQREPKRPWRDAVRIAQTLAAATHYVTEQRGLIHRDLKPQNILLDERGQPHVMDFGLATPNRGQRPSEVAGTPLYMSPEQAAGDAINARSDVWSIGVILYQMLTGRLPFKGSSLAEAVLREGPVAPRQIDRQIPQELESIVLRCLAIDQQDRFGSLAELEERLSALPRGAAAWRAAIAVAIAFAVLAAVGLLWMQTGPASERNNSTDRTQQATLAPQPAAPLALYWHGFVQAQRHGKEVDLPLRDGVTLYNREQYRLVLVPSADCYLYVVGVDRRGPALLFPHGQIQLSNRCQANRECQLPDQNNWYTLDDQIGTETIYLLASHERLTALEELFSSAAPASPRLAAQQLAELAESLASKSAADLRTRGQTIRPDQRLAHARLNSGKTVEQAMEVGLGVGYVVKRIQFEHQAAAP